MLLRVADATVGHGGLAGLNDMRLLTSANSGRRTQWAASCMREECKRDTWTAARPVGCVLFAWSPVPSALTAALPCLTLLKAAAWPERLTCRMLRQVWHRQGMLLHGKV